MAHVFTRAPMFKQIPASIGALNRVLPMAIALMYGRWDAVAVMAFLLVETTVSDPNTLTTAI